MKLKYLHINKLEAKAKELGVEFFMGNERKISIEENGETKGEGK